MSLFLSKNQRIWLIILLSAIFLVSLSYSFYFQIAPSVDARAYDNIALHLIQGLGYRESIVGDIIGDNAIARVGPGYEFFLAIIYYILGHRYAAVWVIQAALLSLSAFLIFLTTREVFKDSWNYLLGISSLVFIGFSPDLITLQGMLMTETLGVFLVILTTYLFFRCFNKENQSAPSVIFLAISLALATLVRTPAGFLIFPMLTYFIVRRQWKSLLVFIIVFSSLFAPWVIRNYKIYHTFIPTNLAYGIDLAAGNHPGASGELEPYGANDLLIAQYGYVKANSLLVREAAQFIFTHPLEFLKITFYRASIYFSFARPTGFWFHLQGLNKIITLLLSSAYSMIIFVLGFWGIYGAFQLDGEKKQRVSYLLAMLAMMPLAIIGIIVETRYRFLAYPFFSVFAGYGLSELLARRISWRPALYLALLLTANTIFDILKNIDRIKERINNFL